MNPPSSSGSTQSPASSSAPRAQSPRASHAQSLSSSLAHSYYSPTKVDIVREATKRVPLNSMNLPEGFHRSDLLHLDCIRKIVPQEELLKLNGIDLSRGKYTDEGPLLILDERVVRAAYVPLDYREGFPTLPNGSPFWMELDFEPIDAFRVFERYLKQGTEQGARRLFSLACDPGVQRLVISSINKQDLDNALSLDGPSPFNDADSNIEGYINGNGNSNGNGNRFHALSESIQPSQQYEHQIARQHERLQRVRDVDDFESIEEIDNYQYAQQRDKANIVNEQLKVWYTLYYWGPRSKSYDIFYLDGIRQSQGMIALSLQNKHYSDSVRLYNRVLEFIEGSSIESQSEDGTSRFWNQITPRVLVDLMKQLGHMSRVSVGLPAMGPAAANSPQTASGLLRALISANEGLGSIGSDSERSHPGRPRLYAPIDEAGAEQTQMLTQAQRQAQISIDEDETVRRIATIFNSAKARLESSVITSTSPESEPKLTPESVSVSVSVSRLELEPELPGID